MIKANTNTPGVVYIASNDLSAISLLDTSPISPASRSWEVLRFPGNLTSAPAISNATGNPASFAPPQAGEIYVIHLQRTFLVGAPEDFYLAIVILDANGEALPCPGLDARPESSLLNASQEMIDLGFAGGQVTGLPLLDAAIRRARTAVRDIAIVTNYGARGDVKIISGVSIASGAHGLSVAGLTSADIGKYAYVTDASATSVAIAGVITGVSGSTITISGAAASRTITSVGFFIYGTDDTAAIQAALNAGDEIRIPAGDYMITGTLTALAFKKIVGAGRTKTAIRHFPGTTGAVLWCGNSTDDVPGVPYQGERFNVSGFSIYTQASSTFGLRCREVIYSSFHDMFVGRANPETPVVASKTALFVDGCINCFFHSIDCSNNDQNGTSIAAQFRPSARLDGVAGSGDGAGATSTKVIACYFHYAGYGLIGTTLNNVTFDHCVFESNGYGVVAADNFKWRLIDPYIENNSHNGVWVQGIDSRNHATLDIDGGWAQRNTDGGYIKTDGTSGVPFLQCLDTDYVRMRGVQMQAVIPIVQIVQIAGTCQQIDIEANPQCFHVGKQATNVHSLANAISTTNGSPNLTLAWTANGLLIGTVIDIQGATSPLNNIAVNRPFWIVIAKPDANTLTLAPLLFPSTYLANATASGLGGGSISVSWYGQGDWAHVVIPGTNVRLTDCEYEVITFSRTFAAIGDMSGGGDLLCDATTDYLFDTHTYIMSLQLVTSDPITAPNPSVRYLQPTLKGAGFDDYVWKLFDHQADSLATEPPEDVLYRVFPGQKLSIKIFMSGDHTETFPRTETVRVVVAKTRYKTVTES